MISTFNRQIAVAGVHPRAGDRDLLCLVSDYGVRCTLFLTGPRM